MAKQSPSLAVLANANHLEDKYDAVYEQIIDRVHELEIHGLVKSDAWKVRNFQPFPES